MVSCEQDDFVTSLRIAEGDKVEAYAGDQVYLHVEGSPSKAPLPELVWDGFDSDIMWVFPKQSKIRVIKSGTTKLTIGTEDKTLTTSCTINISPIKMSLSDTSVVAFVTDTFSLRPAFTPERLPEKLQWNSSNSAVAVVDKNGAVTVKGLGECVITCNADFKYVYEPVSAQCKILSNPIKMTSLMLDYENVELEFGEKFRLNATYEPLNATFTDLHWSSSDESVAKVVDGMITTIGTGDCIITVTNEKEGLSAQCNVNVYVIPMTSLTLDKEDIELELGEKFQLNATFEPSDATFADLHWSSSDESVAKVNSIGMITTTGIGECVVTVSNKENNLTAQCRVTVSPIYVYVQKISLSNSSLEVIVGETHQLSCIISPTDATNKEVKWESSDESVATVSEDGTVTAVNEGEATIKVMALDGSGCSAECSVLVISKDAYIDAYVKESIEVECSKPMYASGMFGYCNFNITISNKGSEEVILEKYKVYSSGQELLLKNPCNYKIGASKTENVDLGSNRPAPPYRVDCYFIVAGKEFVKSATASY